MSAAAVAVLCEDLPDIPCMALVPHPRATEPDVYGERRVRVCVLRNGHAALEIPCRYEWRTEKVDVPVVDQSEVF